MDSYDLIDIELSFQSYEIYNEEIYDLIYDKKVNKENMVKLLVKENQDKKFTVKGIVFIILFFYCKIPQKDK